MRPQSEDKVNILIVDDLADKLLAFRCGARRSRPEPRARRSGDEALRELLEREFAVILS